MKTLVTLAVAVSLTTTGLSAETLFAPEYGTGTPNGAPTGYTVGTPYTATTSGGGTIAYTPSTMTVGDGSNNASTAYLESYEHVKNTNIITEDLTFTPHYSNADPTGSVGGQSNDTLFELVPTTGSNNDVLAVTLQTLGYGNNQASILLSTGIAFGGATQVGSSEYTSSGVDSLNGVTLHLELQQTFVTTMNGIQMITTTGNLYGAHNALLDTFNYTDTDNVQTGYDPANNFGMGGGLRLRVGETQVSNTDGFVNAGQSVTFGAVNVSSPSVPEPSAYALLLGGLGGLAFVARRRMTA